MVKSNIIGLTIKPVGVSRQIQVLISPQYSNDAGVLSAMDTYANAISSEGWDTVMVALDDTTNTVDYIKSLSNPTAMLLIGEDIAIYPQTDDVPSVIPYCNTQYSSMCVNSDCEIPEQSIVMNAVTSILMPNHDDPYDIKSQQIINALNKFSTTRDIQSTYGDQIAMTHAGNRANYDTSIQDYTTELSKIGDVTSYVDTKYTSYLLTQKKLLLLTSQDPDRGSYRGVIITNDGATFTVMSANTFNSLVQSAVVLIESPSKAFGWRNDDAYSFGVLNPPSNVEEWICRAAISNNAIRTIVRVPYLNPEQYIDFTKLQSGASLAEAMIGGLMNTPIIYGDPTIRLV